MNDIVISGDTAAAVAVWDPNSGAPLPAHLAEAMGEMGSNIPDRQTVPTLSYEGKTWQIIKNGERTKLQAQNADGDMVPVPIMRVVVLMFNNERGRAYYPGLYNPAASAPPTCWSADGKAPDASVKDKQSPLCSGCPMSVKGSKVQDGKEMVACSSHRMIAVVPAFDIGADPLRLKIAVTSDYDKEIVEHGWFAFRQYSDFLKSRGVTHTALVITKIKFDVQAQYPKLLFALDRILSPDEVAQMKLAMANPKVGELLAEKWTAAGAAGTLIDDSDIAPQPDLQQADPVQIAAAPASKPKPADPGHIAHAGTEHEVWWDGAAWVKPWLTEAAAPPPALTPPPAPAPEPEPAPAVQHDPRAAALADGWVQHPDSPPHGYKGAEVLDWAVIDAKYPAPGNAVNEVISAPPEASAAPSAGPGATTAASPSDAALSPDVQALLGKWT